MGNWTLNKVEKRQKGQTIMRMSGSGALSAIIEGTKEKILKEIRLHIGIAPATAENFTAIFNHTDAKFDFNLITQAMAGVVDLQYTPDNSEGDIIPDDTQLTLAWANSDGRDWGLTVVVEG